MKLPTTKLKQVGFTLVELLVVIAIIAILISIGLASFSRVQRSSRDSQRRADLKTIQGALEQYYADNNAYPDKLSDLTSGTTVYIREIPQDPLSPTYSYVYIHDTPPPVTYQRYCLTSYLETSTSTTSCSINSVSYRLVVTQQD